MEQHDPHDPLEAAIFDAWRRGLMSDVAARGAWAALVAERRRRQGMLRWCARCLSHLTAHLEAERTPLGWTTHPAGRPLDTVGARDRGRVRRLTRCATQPDAYG